MTLGISLEMVQSNYPTGKLSINKIRLCPQRFQSEIRFPTSTLNHKQSYKDYQNSQNFQHGIRGENKPNEKCEDRLKWREKKTFKIVLIFPRKRIFSFLFFFFKFFETGSHCVAQTALELTK
jgi:hypothetical protein